MPEKIATVIVEARTTNDNKEDSQFEVIVKQGATNILWFAEGAGVDWPEGDVQEFPRELDVDLTGENIEVIVALQDGPWGWSNHWNAHIKDVVRTSVGHQLVWERDCAFRTAEARRRHEFNLGTKRFGSLSSSREGLRTAGGSGQSITKRRPRQPREETSGR